MQQKLGGQRSSVMLVYFVAEVGGQRSSVMLVFVFFKRFTGNQIAKIYQQVSQNPAYKEYPQTEVGLGM